jgi:hypothetical protein
VQRQQAKLDGADDAKTAMHAQAHFENQIRIRTVSASAVCFCGLPRRLLPFPSFRRFI